MSSNSEYEQRQFWKDKIAQGLGIWPHIEHNGYKYSWNVVSSQEQLDKLRETLKIIKNK